MTPRSLAKLTDTLHPMLDGCLNNRKEWERLAGAGNSNCTAAAEGEEEKD